MTIDGRLKVGNTIGNWQINETIGSGGNAFVYRVTGPDARQCALKEPKRFALGDEPYERFRREVETLRALTGVRNIVDVVDSHLPDSPTKRCRGYYIMPLMERVADAAQGLPAEEIITGIQTIAQALASLAERGIHHRDLKPANMYLHQGEWVVGDFGLVKLPDKDALTVEGARIGPAWYIAPEMLTNREGTRAEPADVYSLAKTLWVLLTGQNYPLPGPHYTHSEPLQMAYSVGSYRALSRTLIQMIDSFMVRATSVNPEGRQTMREVEVELRMIVRPAIGERDGMTDITEIARRIKALTRSAADEKDRGELVSNQLDELLQRLKQGLEPTELRLQQELGTVPVFLIGSGNVRPRMALESQYSQELTRAIGITIHTRDEPTICLHSGFVAAIDLDGSMYLRAGHYLAKGTHRAKDILHSPGETVWEECRKFPCGSVAQENAISELVAGLEQRWSEALERFRLQLEED